MVKCYLKLKKGDDGFWWQGGDDGSWWLSKTVVNENIIYRIGVKKLHSCNTWGYFILKGLFKGGMQYLSVRTDIVRFRKRS